MKPADKKRGPPPTGARTGPRARAAQERQFADPYQRASRPPRAAEPGERPAGRNSVVTLEPDVARAFRTSEAVNEALRLVLRLARLAAPRPAFERDRPGRPGPFPARGAGGQRRGPDRGSDRSTPRDEGRPPMRAPRFDESE